MDTSLDFVTRARHALKELRHPHLNDPNHPSNALSSGDGDVFDDERRASVFPVAPIDPSVALTQFRLLVGIYQDKSFAPPRGWLMNRRPQASVQHRPAPNLGIYTTVCEKEITAKRNYKSFSRLVNVCLGLQLIVAAALTALGAASGSSSAVTVFGAINTVIAGFLTYLKGSGLPNRLKYFQHEWEKVREYIEQKERDFMLAVPGLDVQEEVEKVRQMYEAVKQDVQTNTPERFVSASQLAAQMHAAQRGTEMLKRPMPALSTSSINGKWVSEKEAEAGAAVRETSSGLFAKFGYMKNALGDKVKEMGEMEKEIEAGGQHAYESGRSGLQETQARLNNNLSDVAHLGSQIQTNATAAAVQSADAARNAAMAQREAADAAIGQSSSAATAAIAGQRDAAHTALYGEHHPQPPAS